ncbi:hypothetical protein [Muribaculum sp.]|uniref:hypothetical protein n=1 Tax=Muribaculum sp. TaxID=1918611 RepID=UPI0023C45980|nr:hypothetical protein [Muribaculum sp.]MDE5706549.1 hypothetical protein [Muribaculum sp.]
MNLTKILFIGALATAALSSCTSSEEPSYVQTLPRTMLVTTVDNSTSQTHTTLTSANVGLDLYNNTTATFSIANVRMPNDAMKGISAGPMKYTANSISYTFVPQATTTFTGVSDPSIFQFYMGGVNLTNSRLDIVDGDVSVLGYSHSMYLFTSATITGSATPVTTVDAKKNVVQVLIQNGEADRQYKATIYWMNPEFDNSVKIEEGTTLGIDKLVPVIDPSAGTLTISGGSDAPIVPKRVERGSSTLTTEMTEYKISNVVLTVSDFANTGGRLTFDFEYTPKPAEGDEEVPVTTTYHFSGVLREAPANM